MESFNRQSVLESVLFALGRGDIDFYFIWGGGGGGGGGGETLMQSGRGDVPRRRPPRLSIFAGCGVALGEQRVIHAFYYRNPQSRFLLLLDDLKAPLILKKKKLCVEGAPPPNPRIPDLIRKNHYREVRARSSVVLYSLLHCIPCPVHTIAHNVALTLVLKP